MNLGVIASVKLTVWPQTNRFYKEAVVLVPVFCLML